MNALGVAQPHSDATDVTSWRSASNTSACCRRSWVRHCGNVIPSSSLNRRLSVRWLTPIRPPICCSVKGWVTLSAINAHACRNRRSVGEGTHSGSRCWQLILQYGQHPVVLVGVGSVGLRTRDDEFAHQRIDREHRRGCRAAAIALRIQRYAVKLRVAVELVLVPTARRYPDCPIYQRNPGSRVSGDRDRPCGRIDDLV